MLDFFDTKDKYSMLYLIWWIYIYACAYITGKKEGDLEWRKSLNRCVAEQGMGIECLWKEIVRRDYLGDRKVPVRMGEVEKEKWTGKIKTILHGTFVWKYNGKIQ